MAPDGGYIFVWLSFDVSLREINIDHVVELYELVEPAMNNGELPK